MEYYFKESTFHIYLQVKGAQAFFPPHVTDSNCHLLVLRLVV